MRFSVLGFRFPVQVGGGRRRRLLLVAALAAAALPAALLLGVVPPAPPATPAGATVTELLDGLRVALPQEPVAAPEFKLDGVDGRPISLADLRGRLVFLNFWATWCKPCRREMPAMERLYRAYRDRGLAVVAVNFREPQAPVKAFLEEMGLTFATPLDLDGTVTRTYGVRGLPATFLADRDGKILWKAQGAREWDSPNGRGYFDRVLAAGPR